MKTWWLALLCALLLSCSEGKQEKFAIINDIQQHSSGAVNLSTIFADYKLIPLETDSLSLISDIDKIIKKKGVYYINSGKRLLVFNAQGKFIRQISNQGGGPEEYRILLDYDIDTNKKRIAILDVGSIHYYHLNGKYDKTISLEYGADRLKILPDGSILLNSYREEDLICIIDQQGKEISRYLKRKHRHLVRKANPFIQIGNLIYYQDGARTNDFWYYNWKTKQTGIVSLLASSDGISSVEEEELMSTQGSRYIENTPTKIKIRGISSYTPYGMSISFKDPDGACLYYFKPTGENRAYNLEKNPQIIDDITFQEMPNSLFMSFQGSSDDGFISVIQPYSVLDGLENNKNQTSKNYAHMKGIIESMKDPYEANPIIFEFNLNDKLFTDL